MHYRPYPDDLAAKLAAEEESATSRQKLGDTECLVDFVAPHGVVSINGAWLNGEFVEASEFGVGRLERWRSLIQREYDLDEAQAHQCDHDRFGAPV